MRSFIDFMARIGQVDKDADEQLGEGVFSYQDVLEIVVNELQIEVHNDAVEKAKDVIRAIGLEYADYDQTRDGRSMAADIIRAIEQLKITK